MSSNVFTDLGFSEHESADIRLRYTLMEALLAIIARHKYTQKELIAILQQQQPHVSNLMKGKISHFSSEKLTLFLHALDAQVQVKVKLPKTKVAI